MLYLVGLACGCIRTVNLTDFPADAVCGSHSHYEYDPHITISQQIIAIEARQYHVRCCRCRFGRWAGNSKPDADLLKNKHMISTGHLDFMTDFMVPEDRKRTLRQHYPRTVKLGILDGFTEQRDRINARIKRPVITTVYLPDEPPF